MKHLKRHFSLLAAIIVMTIPAFSQTIQNGVVMEYRMWNKKKPLAGVEIDVKYAGSTTSDKKGEFQLKFNTLKPGTRVSVNQIEKSGYEIFNKEAVNQWNLSGDGQPFMIIMARSKDMMKLRDNYSSQSSKSYKKQREKETARINQMLADGKIKEQEHKKRLRELEDWYAQKIGNINTYVDHFSRFDLSELSKEENEIIRLVQQGEFDDAIKRYDLLDPSGKYKQCVQNINEIDTAIHVLIDEKEKEKMRKDSVFAAALRQIDVLKMAGGRDNFEKIDDKLKDMVLADTTDLRCVYTYADFLAEQKSYDGALRFYRRCLRLTNDPLTISQVKGKIGLLELELGHFNESQEALLTSHNIIHDLSLHNKGYSKYYAKSIHDLASLYTDMREFNKAEKYYLQSLEEYQLMANDGDSCTIEILTLKNDLGQMYYEKRDFDKALTILTSAYSPIQQKYNSNPIAFKPLMAQLENNLGLVNRRYLNYDSAESHYLSSLRIYKDLYDFNPSAYRKSLAGINGEISSLYERTMNPQKAQEFLNSSIAYYDTLLLASKDASIPSFVRMQINLMNLYLDNKKYEKIVPLLEQTYNQINSLYEYYPKVYRSDLCDALSIIGRYHVAHKQYQEAKAFFERANLLSDTLCFQDASSYLYQRFETLNNLSGVSDIMKLYQEDSIYSHMAYDVCCALYRISPVVYAPNMAQMAFNMSVHYFHTNNYSIAKKYSDEAEKIYESLFVKQPLIFGDDYSKALHLAARLSVNHKDSIGYESYIFKAYELTRGLYQKDHKIYGEEYVKCLREMSLLLYDTNIEQSLAYSLESLEIIREMFRNEPEVYVNTMVEDYLVTSLLYRGAKDYNKAMAMIDSALAVTMPFYEKQPQSFRVKMATCYFNKGRFADSYIGDKDLAIENFKLALPLYQVEMENAKAAGQEAVATEHLDYVQSIHVLLYNIYKERGSYQEAIEQLKEMLLLEPDDEGVKQEIRDLENLISPN